MSFPPGPPIPMPGMPPVPPMMPPPYPVPPMGLQIVSGMIPMTVGMMPAPMMGPVAMTMPAPLPMPPHQKLIKKVPQHTPAKKIENNFESQDTNRGPPVTVFVGNITERASDALIRQILQRCGIVLNWKRVQGANGKLQAFGFCEYGDPESALRCIRLLHDWEIADRKLVVKVDAKTKEKLDEYKATKWAKQQQGDEKDKVKSENVKTEEGEASDDALDEFTKQRDETIKISIEALIKAHESELSKPVEGNVSSRRNTHGSGSYTKNHQIHDVPLPPPTPSTHHERSSKSGSNEGSPKPKSDYERIKKNELDEMDLEDDKRSLIHREIDKFRDTYQVNSKNFGC